MLADLQPEMFKSSSGSLQTSLREVRQRVSLKGIRRPLGLLLLLLLVGCQNGDEPATSPAETAAILTDTPAPALATTAAPSATIPAPPTLTPPSTSLPPTAAATATADAPATAQAELAATWAAVAPAPHLELTQPPYAASDCSDKYPCNEDAAAWEARIQVPPGFDVRTYARLEGHPTSLAFGPDGLLYVATQEGQIVIVDQFGEILPYVEGLDTPTATTFQPGTDRLYITNRLRSENSGGEAEVAVVEDGRVSQVFGGIPCCYTFLHAANGIAFGPDGFGYVSVGARADHGEILPGLPGEGQLDELDPWEASVLRFSPDGTLVVPYARGLRNAYDLVFDAAGDLYATDNAPDYGPPDELHKVIPGGQHGYPWYDCEFCFSPPEGMTLIPPLLDLPPHSAAAGITAYLAGNFPGYYNNLFLALWSAFPEAQRIVRYDSESGQASSFATGFAAPIDLAVGPEGNLYVADWATGIIFVIFHIGR